MESEEHRKRSIWTALRRRAGMGPEAREKLEEANEKASNWRAICRRCGAQLRGTLAELQEHRCG